MPSQSGMDGGSVRRLVRDELGVDPADLGVVLDLAAIGITNGVWRNSPLEDWHSQGRLGDGAMLRTNAATTKLVMELLDDFVAEELGWDETVQVDDFAAVDPEASDELFLAVLQTLADPDRGLPDGRTLRDLAGDGLDELVDHMDGALGGIAGSAERGGLDVALLRSALHGGLACPHWWGTPWWPDTVEAFVAYLDDPEHPHWGKAKGRDWYARLPPAPPQVADRTVLRELLLAAPEELPEAAADYCVAAGIGYVREPAQAWRAAHGVTRQQPS